MAKGKKKYCHCKPTCGRLLSARQRRRHYKLVSFDSIRPSLSPVSAEADDPSPTDAIDSDSDLSRSPSPDLFEPLPEDTEMEWHPPADAADLDGCASDDGMDVDSTMSDSTSCSEPEIHSPSQPDLELDPWSAFDEFQDLDEPITREEMRRNLEDMLGPDEEWGNG